MADVSTTSATGRNQGRVAEYQKYDFLKGEGPSSSQYYYTEPKKAFKAGWNHLRPYDAIRPDEQRLKEQAFKDARSAATQQIRCQRLQEATHCSFNPISGKECKPDGTWAPATDPWAHQKPTVKRVPHDTAAKQVAASRVQHNQQAYSLRQQRIANDGLTTTKRANGTAKDALQWQG